LRNYLSFKGVNVFLEGFIFGMVLQFTIGPVCLYVLNSAISSGVLTAFISVTGVTAADAVYIILAIMGVSGLGSSVKMQAYFKAIGGTVLILFGLYIVAGVFLPVLTSEPALKKSGFIPAFLLTISNPLSIIYWSGIFALRVKKKEQSKSDQYRFGFGAVLSTLVFLSCVVALGAVFHFYLPAVTVKVLNVLVGVAIITFGIVFFNRKVGLP
jgi:threonine/homoserine/homoserine lactone efflux protein